MVLQDQFKQVIIFLRHVIIFVHIKWHRYTNYIFSYKLCLVPYFIPTYFIWVSWSIKPHWNTKFAIQNKLWPSNIFHSKLFFNQWISRALQEFWSSLYYHHKKSIITNSFSIWKYSLKLLYNMHFDCMHIQRDLFILLSHLFNILIACLMQINSFKEFHIILTNNKWAI